MAITSKPGSTGTGSWTAAGASRMALAEANIAANTTQATMNTKAGIVADSARTQINLLAGMTPAPPTAR